MFILFLSSHVGITSYSLKQFSKLSLSLVQNIQTHLVCSPRSFKTEIIFAKLHSNNCSTFLREHVNCDNMSFFFVNSFVALQLSMMNKVGKPACLLKNIPSNSFIWYFIWCYWIDYSYTFVFWVLHVTNPSPGFFICFVPFYGGAKYDYIFKKIFIFNFNISSTNIVFPHLVWPQLIAEWAYFGNSTENHFESSLFEIVLCILYYI